MVNIWVSASANWSDSNVGRSELGDTSVFVSICFVWYLFHWFLCCFICCDHECGFGIELCTAICTFRRYWLIVTILVRQMALLFSRILLYRLTKDFGRILLHNIMIVVRKTTETNIAAHRYRILSVNTWE